MFWRAYNPLYLVVVIIGSSVAWSIRYSFLYYNLNLSAMGVLYDHFFLVITYFTFMCFTRHHFDYQYARSEAQVFVSPSSFFIHSAS
jgi:hypothetical protein